MRWRFTYVPFKRPRALRGSPPRRRPAVGEDLGQPVDVDLGERRLTRAGLAALDPIDELGAEDVDLAVQEPAAVRHLLLLAHVALDEGLELLVGDRGEI